MDKTGLIWKFKVNRTLTFQEMSECFSIGKSVGEPFNALSTIKMNSTYLECCDKFYHGRGEITAGGIYGFILLSIALYMPVYEIFSWSTTPEYERGETLAFIIAIFAMVIPAMLYVWFTWLNKEVFRYTHYPIRFNRKTRRVHFFRLDGTVMSESWEKLFFTVGMGKEFKILEVRCHRLAEDGRTVLETHALPSLSRGDNAPAQWEFVRRYMEVGPAEVLPHIDHVLDVHIGQPGKRESFEHGYEMISKNEGSFMFYFFFFMSFPYVIGRWIAMRTCKQPVWPTEIEAECVIEPNDPYLVDAHHLPEGVKA